MMYRIVMNTLIWFGGYVTGYIIGTTDDTRTTGARKGDDPTQPFGGRYSR